MFVCAENSSTPEFYAEQTGEIVDDSIYERNRIVSERLGVTFEFVENPCNFDKGNSVFTLMELIYAYTTLRDVDFDYGILPVPKFDEEQENYNTVASFPYTLYAIPLDAKDPELAAAVMECLAGEGHRHVTPALFEVALKVKYSQDDNDARMYDIIRGSVIFDIGRVFSDNLGAFSWSYFRTAINENQTEWMSTVAEISDGVKSAIAKLFDELGEQ